MGILNVTPDSFSDGGAFLEAKRAIEHGLRLREQGADLVDVGGESTRPGADRVGMDEELRRILPVVRELVAAKVPVSVDTTSSHVADAALQAGACMINDVSGGLNDPHMAKVIAEAGVPWIVMHTRGDSRTMQQRATYRDVVQEVLAELEDRLNAARAAGVREEQLVIDPGLGFAKTAAQTWTLIANLGVLSTLGMPVLVGASRKSFLGSLLVDRSAVPRPVEGREVATDAITMHAAMCGMWGIRVHNVRSALDVAMTAAAIRNA